MDETRDGQAKQLAVCVLDVLQMGSEGALWWMRPGMDRQSSWLCVC